MEDLKEDRSALKRKVTVLASRLKRAVKKEMSSSAIRGIFAELEEVYLDFLAKDDEYNLAIEEDDQLEGEFAEVNGLNLVDYTDSVDSCYKEAQSVYNQHRKKKSKGKGTVTSDLDSSEEEAKDDDDDDDKVKEENDTKGEVREDIDSEGKLKHESNLDAPKVTEASLGLKGDQTSTPQSCTSYTPSPADLLFSAFTSQGASCIPQSSHLASLQFPPHPSYTGNYQNLNQPFSSMSSGTVPISLRSATSPGIMSSGMIPSSSGLAPGYAPYFPYGMIPSSSGTVPGSAASNLIAQPPNTSMHIKVKAAELPHFSGLRKDWPQFKSLWPKLAIPAYPSREMLACQLQICIKNTLAARMTDHISIIGPQSFDDIWNCLSEYYDDEAAAANEILKELSDLKIVKSEDYRSLVEHINKVEGYYTQLASLKEMGSLSMREVDNLAGKLPENIKKEWHKKYQQLLPEHKLRPFQAYVTYLKEERKYIVRLAEQQPSTYKKRDVATNNANFKGTRMKPKCAIHRMENTMHTTEKCNTFIQMAKDDKLKVLREVGGCYKCLGYHKRGRCPCKETCGTCGRTGHKTVLCLTSSGGQAASGSHNQVPPQFIGSQNNQAPPQFRGSQNQPPQSSGNLHVPVTTHASQNKGVGLYAIFSVPVVGSRRYCSVFADDGSDCSYITNKAAKKLGARKLDKYVLEVTTTGGKETEYESTEYELDLITKSGRILTIRCFGLDTITGNISILDPAVISKLFPDHDSSLLTRRSKEVDVLLGTDYFGAHPKKEICTAGEHLSIMEGELGICLQGSHPSLDAENSMDSNMVKVLKAAQLKIATNIHLTVASVKHSIFEKPLNTAHPHKAQSHITNAEFNKVQNFIQGEELGTQINPKCGSCKCSTCPQLGHTYSFQEEAELKVIQDNLKYDENVPCWKTKYPWRCDPKSLPDNKPAALATLHRQEKRLKKDEDLAKVYKEQIQDMLNRGVARVIPQEEIDKYTGPFYYISHLGVPNPRSKSTPYRIVFNSSQVYKGTSLNNFLLKGPDSYLNNQLGILLRWREEQVGLVGDIKKMFNSVHLELEEQHCHRFLWGNLNSTPSTYCMTRVNMGDKPAGAISTEALYMTADKFSADHPQAAVMLKEGSYVDDLMESVPGKEEALDLSKGAEEILAKGGFQVKFWLFSGCDVEEDDGVVKVLGVGWKPKDDTVGFQASLNFSPKKQGIHIHPDLKPEEISRNIPVKLTKRIVLAQVMRIYDPLGLLSPFTFQGKVLLRKSWQLKLGWDEALPSTLHEQWSKFFIESGEISKIWYPRTTKPENSIGKPILVIYSDASDEAYGFVAYARWECSDGEYESRLIMAKSRIAPLTKRTTPQLELNAAVMGKRAREVILKEMRYEFSQVIHIIDSETVRGMLWKLSTRFQLYEGVRVGEIQVSNDGDVSNWAWISTEKNIADWITRGKDLADLDPTSEWFQGFSYMRKPVEEWGLKFGAPTSQQSLPGEKKNVSSNYVQLEEENSGIISYERFSNFRRLVRSLARVLNAYSKLNVNVLKEEPTVVMIEKASDMIVKDMQKSIEGECIKKDRQGRVGGAYRRYKPVLINGLWCVGTRLQFNPLVPENKPQYLLPTKHNVTKLMMMQAHKEVVHRGRDTTLARFRQKYWILQGSKIANSVVINCQLCKYRNPKLLVQKMGSLPIERSCPAPAFTYCMVDYFGPYTVRGEVQKRISGKAWAVIFTDLVSRAVFIEAVYEYSADAFLIALSKFASVRGYPRVMYSDPASNLECASKELGDQWKSMWEEDGEKIISHSSENGMEWRFSTADSAHQNGAVEALVKSSKKVLNIVMQNQRLSPSELAGVLYGVANTLNERPIGVMTEDSELSILTPNSLLLGRSTAKNPGGWYPTSNTLERFNLVRQIEESWWKQWIKSTAPDLITDAKWHAPGRELQPGDVVLVADSDNFKSQYKLAVVQETFRSSDGAVRKARVLYKSYKVGDREVKYRSSAGQSVTRAVQRLALVVPIDT